VFLVSHDRRFLDDVVTSTIAWEGDVAPGLWREYEGGYEDWQIQRERARALRESAAARTAPAAKARAAAVAPSPAAATKPRKLGYREQRELDTLPARIEALEQEQKDLAALLASAELYAEDPPRAEAAQMRYVQIDDELLAALERWEALASV
jgi:ATP-binding cassette subfamily F protein uup